MKYDYTEKTEQYTIHHDSDNSNYIECHTCGKHSYHPKDIEHLFCAKCDKYHDQRGDNNPLIAIDEIATIPSKRESPGAALSTRAKLNNPPKPEDITKNKQD